jgi:glycosyltransferase involved in cell wall biosynthesis
MRVLILNYEFPPLGGGGGHVAQSMAEDLVKRFSQVDVVTSRFKNLPKKEKITVTENDPHSFYTVYRVGIFGRRGWYSSTLFSMMSFLFTGFFKSASLLQKSKYDYINTHFAIPTGPVGVLLAKIFRIKNTLNIHGGDIYNPNYIIRPEKNILTRTIIRWVLNNSDTITAHSADVKHRAQEYYSPNKAIEIVPIGFKPIPFKVLDRTALGLRPDRFYFITVARLVPRKRIDRMIAAMSQAHNDRIALLIIGDGPERQHLESQAEALGLGDSIQFLGFVPDEKKLQLLSCSDAFITTSIHEGFGITIQEAMYCGLPLIAPNQGGYLDFIVDKVNALLYNDNQRDGLIASMQQLYANENLRKTLGKNNREQIKKSYTVPEDGIEHLQR